MGGMWIIIAIALVAILLIAFSRIMNIMLGVLTTLAGVGAYIWFGDISSAEFQWDLAIRFNLNPFDLRNYTLILAGVGVVILIIGLLRGARRHKVTFVQTQPTVHHIVHTQTGATEVKESPKVEETPKATEPVKEDTKNAKESKEKKEEAGEDKKAE